MLSRNPRPEDQRTWRLVRETFAKVRAIIHKADSQIAFGNSPLCFLEGIEIVVLAFILVLARNRDANRHELSLVLFGSEGA